MESNGWATARPWLAALLLVGLSVAVYAPVRDFEFITLDDRSYVERNPAVNQGISAGSIAWAVTAVHVSNWHPLTWVSHQLDVELFGLEPGRHHATNAVLHALAACLLFGALRAATGSDGRSLAVAALFAVHPLNVEPVAWVAQRKTLLCAVFAFGAIWSYVGWARRGGGARFAAVTGLFAASLLAKPLAVTLPFVFVLLDRWPLERLESRADALARTREKALWFAMAAGVCVVTWMAQASTGATQDLEAIEPGARLANALVSYLRYLGLAFWPDSLAVYYPHPYLPGGRPWAFWQVLGAVVVLVAITASVLGSLRSRAVAIGWLWFLGTAVPTLGLVQVGSQALADRYFYLPGVGLGIAVVWLAADLRRIPRPALAIATALVVTAFAARARDQVAYWSDSRTLYEHSLEVAPGSPLLAVKLGILLRAAGEPDAAIARYYEALRYDPDYYSAHHNLGTIYRERGEHAAAVVAYERAVEIRPDNASSHYYLGASLRMIGEEERAERHVRRAYELREQQRARDE